MLKLQAAKTVPALKSVPALKLIPATKVESATDKSAKVRHGGHPTADSHQYLMLIQDKNLFHSPVQLYMLIIFASLCSSLWCVSVIPICVPSVNL